MAMHPLVQEVVDDYLAAVDAEVPKLIEGLYLVGSVALDDFRPQASDIDFVAVTDGQLPEADIVALERAHVALAAHHRRPFFDGAYVTWRDLSVDPSLAGPGAGVHEGQLYRRDAGGCDPVAWHTLAGHGVTVRGPHRDEIPVWTNREALAAWTHQNLDDYWKVWLRRSSRLVSRPGLACVLSWGPAWGVLGVSRLHYTLATGAIASKYGAGLYAREVFDPRWRRIIDECLRLRRGEGGRALYRNPLTRRREALDFIAMAIEGAHSVG
jgi:Domain of unknown function (DUF4111)/Nucleotidyltransferase domain